MQNSNNHSSKFNSLAKNRTSNRSLSSKSRYSNSTKHSNNTPKDTRRADSVKWLADHLKNGGTITIHSPCTPSPDVSPCKPKSPSACPHTEVPDFNKLANKGRRAFKCGIDFSKEDSKPVWVELDTRNLMDFSEALLHLKQGEKVSRLSWYEGTVTNEIFLSMPLLDSPKDITETSVWGSHNQTVARANQGHVSVLPYITKTVGNKLTMGWLPTSEDLFAKDYFIA